MLEIANKDVLVIGLGDRGRAACELLARQKARVWGVDIADTPQLRSALKRLSATNIRTDLGLSSPPAHHFDLAVLSPAVPVSHPMVQEIRTRGIPIIGELELGYQSFGCLNIAVAGTNGKSTTTELVEQVLTAEGRRTCIAGDRARPVCAIAENSRDQDFLILLINAFQLESTTYFRPAVAVLTNLTPDHLDRYETTSQYVSAHAGLFRKQQAFDWAVVQSEALAALKAAGVEIPSKIISFSATEEQADLYLDRGLIISRLPNWSGPLLDMDRCRIRGPHNAENIMAALAVGHVSRLPLEGMIEAIKAYEARPHRFQLVAEIDGVQFINDSKASNPAALGMSLRAARPGQGGTPNVWLIAGGRDKGLDYHEVGPLLAERVKGAFLVGEAAEKLRAAWSLFTPCTVASSLIEAVITAARNAARGDVVLLSPACSAFDQFRNYTNQGQSFCEAVKSIGGGLPGHDPNIRGSVPGSLKT